MSLKQVDAIAARLLHTAVYGHGLSEASCVPGPQGLLQTMTRLQMGKDYVDSVKVRGNLLPTGSMFACGRL